MPTEDWRRGGGPPSNHRGTSASSSSELRAPILKSSGFLKSRPMDLHDFVFFWGIGSGPSEIQPETRENIDFFAILSMLVLRAQWTDFSRTAFFWKLLDGSQKFCTFFGSRATSLWVTGLRSRCNVFALHRLYRYYTVLWVEGFRLISHPTFLNVWDWYPQLSCIFWWY